MLFMLVLTSNSGMAQAAEPNTQQFGEDVYASGGRVALQAQSSGDAVVAGRRVSVTGRVDGDGMFAGGNVNVDSSVGGDLYAAGGEVRVAGIVEKNARLAGGNVVLAPEGEVNGSVAIFGGRVSLEGHVREYALVSGGRIYVNGRIDGDLRVVAGELALGPSAVIQGRLYYRGERAPSIDPAAQVGGGIIAPEVDAEEGVPWIAFVLMLSGAIIASAVLLLLAPAVVRRVTEAVRARPLIALLVGLVVLIILPLITAALMVSVVGIPLAFLLLSTLLLLVILGYVTAAIALGDGLVERRGPATPWQRVGATAVALLVLFLIALIPNVGWLVWPVAMAVGVGGIVRTVAAVLAWKRRTA